MNMTKNRTYVALILAVVLTFSLSLVQVPGAYAAESSAQEKTLSFLADVIMLDLANYNVTLLYDEVSYPTELDGITQEEIRYKLETNGSDLDITFVYRNNMLAFGTIYVNPSRSLVHYTKSQPANLIDAAKGLLDRYQSWTGSSHYQELRDALDLVNEAESTTVTLGNVELDIYAKGSLASFDWTYTYDGITKPGLYLSFRDGNVETINVQWNLFEVGNTMVSISEEEAIAIARERTKNFSWKVGLDPNATEIKDFTILETPLNAELSLQAREPLTVYPFWRVDLYLDKTYPGNIFKIAVGIWADTGEVRYITALSHGGGLPSESPADEPPPSKKPGLLGTDLQMEYGYALAVVTVVAIAAATGYLYLKRKK
jgi:hypothetical protein